MATLTQAERIILRQAVARKAEENSIPIDWIKDCLHNIGQAIEDILDSTVLRTQVSDAIDIASMPYGVFFTNTEKGSSSQTPRKGGLWHLL